MDSQVIAAMARWPDVPDVYGWLSLSPSGQWRLHPQGDALVQPDSPGEAITSPQILAFLGRNYAADAQGQWFFQNGPQRVYVRLDAAPYILHTTSDAATGRLKLRTHTGLDVLQIDALYLDDTGHLYILTDRGPGLLAGRDLPAFLDALIPAGDARDTDEVLAECLETGRTAMLTAGHTQGFDGAPVALRRCADASLEDRLHFRRLPVPPATPRTEPASGSGPGSH